MAGKNFMNLTAKAIATATLTEILLKSFIKPVVDTYLAKIKESITNMNILMLLKARDL
jgi:hypothetical protein